MAEVTFDLDVNVIGIDVATALTGVSVFDGKDRRWPAFGVFTAEMRRFDFSYNTFIEWRQRFKDFMDKEIMPFINLDLPTIFTVEGVMRGGHFIPSLKIGVARTAVYSVIAALPRTWPDLRTIDVLSPPVQIWKAAVLGKANASKIITYAWMADNREQYKIPLPILDSPDLIDASCLVLFTLANLESNWNDLRRVSKDGIELIDDA